MNHDYNGITVAALTTTYDLKLVVLSMLIAMLASFSAFGIVERSMSASQQSQKILWNLFGALMMSVGIWAMHFIAMVSLTFPIPVSYDLATTMVSILPVMFASSIVMWLMTLKTFSYYRLLIAGLLLGPSIGLMHYIAMGAMRLQAVMVHDMTLVYLSILIAVILAMVALKIQYAAINQHQYQFITKKHLVSAVVMGLASSSMHYSAMTAVHFIPQTTDQVIDAVPPTTLALIVTVVILVLLLLTMLIPHLLRYKQLVNSLNAEVLVKAEILHELDHRSKAQTEQDTQAVKAAQAALLAQKAAMDEHSLVSITDVKGTINYANTKFCTVSGYSQEELIGANHRLLNSKQQPKDYWREMYLIISKDGSWNDDICNLAKDGQEYWVNTTIIPLYVDEKLSGYTSIRTDITEHKKSEKKLKLANEEKDKRAAELALAAIVFSHTREGIIITDASASIIKVNNTFTEVTGYSHQEAVGKNLRFFQSDSQSAEFYALMWQAVNSKGYWVGTIWNRRKNGEVYPENLTLSAVKNAASEISHYVALYSDITELNKTHQSQLQRMAHYDDLTDLPNRTLLAQRLNQAILQSNRQHNSLAVAFIDLDDLKTVNDAHGHHVGDELLIIISLRMKEALREGDTLARIGGDEFVLVLTDLTKTEEFNKILERLLLVVSAPVIVDDLVLNVSASIGVTQYPQDESDAEILIRHADQAMYMAKKSGKNCYHLFDSALDDAVNLEQEKINNISAVLDKGEFVLYYQPKVNMSTGEVVGVEALIRWQHPIRGLVPPLDFLPLIENHAISLDIGEWVIDTALSQISQWQSIGITLPISVNISAYQLQKTDFVERLATLLAAHPDVSPHLLELEVLETSALNDINYIIATMKSCISLGVQFALDDFGTGYSSLTYLRRLPASQIKIDQSFIRDMLIDPDDLAIVKGVVSLAKAFQLEVIAEGVETVEHGTELLQLGCKLAQGYGIARPMPASAVLTWLDSWQPDSAWLS
ncbi:EAL domain-containing protein [Colwellia sp. MB02u-18]|uniref:bifunctional diguanylate cyclase/phosphodiesterase n=1 Tax=unclassified Colwellia TaxID=196834 RepID=UPI0015F3EEF3|nr:MULTISPECIES: EAL domain-containing protein [unclassified Colwellia]MBA6225898.1 EAL domain-containing protein [Colwellia sp. MB3u-45]MBA6267134.1 EAL domain-containing protein [Colwellia sp. MB3u-43]MBA6322058.1 EAL domain-containing protein [Colwellia sp. MB02u-19]MBA6325288.1 EAL domain-containing protein [Colwellia sp. MB02u-18]MBA6330307.1 EAL domain-containing protein [Colwellia sp. MB02u-12]